MLRRTEIMNPSQPKGGCCTNTVRQPPFLVQINRQKPSQQPSRKKSSAFASTGSHRLLHNVLSHRQIFDLLP